MTPVALHLSMTTVYLLPCDGGYLQIDTGYSWDYPRYRRQLADAGIALEEIRYLLLTHHHDDHSGFLGDLVRDSRVTVIAHAEAKELLRQGSNDRSRGGGYVSRRIELLGGLKRRLDRRWTLTFPPFDLRPDDILVSGDEPDLLRSRGVDGNILATPGHCVDHIVLVLDSGELFCGDAAARMFLWAGTKYCTVFMSDMDEAYASWRRMLEAGATTVYPAHGRPFPAAKLRRNLDRIPTSRLRPVEH